MKKVINIIIYVMLGLFSGWLLFHNSGKGKNETDIHDHGAEVESAVIWTCSMHPQIRMDEPGDCPICGMDLIPLEQGSSTGLIDPAAVRLTSEAAELARIQTFVVSRGSPVKEVRLNGKVLADERLIQSQVAHVSGRIEKLAVSFTGEYIQKGQVLATVYSPELITAQQELLEASRTKQSFPQIYEASKERLRQLKISETIIDRVENSGNVLSAVDIVSGTSGIVISRNVSTGDYVGQGTVLFQVADLSRLWVMFDAYESDLPFLRRGDRINFTVQALPGRTFTGVISYIDPVINPVTRVARVRVETANNSNLLKPEMFATGIAEARISGNDEGIIVPKSSVLWTGQRSIVYVKQPESGEPVFIRREVELGPDLGSSYLVVSGLSEGEEIVTNGTFSVDAAAQLAGKPSMMNTAGGPTSTGHVHSVSQITVTEPSAGPSVQTASTSTVNTNNISTRFKNQLTSVYDEYLSLKNELVAGDVSAAREYASATMQSLGKTDMSLLNGDAHLKWMDILDKLNDALATINETTDIEKQRSAFSEISNNFYDAVREFGLTSETVYYQFCPMYNDNKGAYWLSESADIRNPYYGSAMLTCGEIRDTLEFR